MGKFFFRFTTSPYAGSHEYRFTGIVFFRPYRDGGSC